MSTGNKIVLISDNSQANEILLSKINLLRDTDIVQVVQLNDSIDVLKKLVPEIIIFYAETYNNSCFDLLDEIKSTAAISNIPILFVCDRIEQDFILSAFDSGIDDYILLAASEAEISMRIIWCLQKSVLVKKCSEHLNQLVNLEVVYSDNYFYREEYVDKIFAGVLKNLSINKKQGSFLIMTPDIDCKQKLSPSLLASILKKNVRTSDIVGIKENDKFYILLQNTPIEAVEGFYNRFKEELTEEYSVCVGAADALYADFVKIEKFAKIALQDALVQKKSFVISEPTLRKNSENWFDSSDMSVPHKNFKLFKQSFTKKLNNVITPVFYQMQKMYEETLFETEIEQFSAEDKSFFALKKGQRKSILTINYPGFSKINIDFSHNGVNREENSRISLSLSELDNQSLSSIIEQFIKEFKSYSNG